MGAVLVEIGPDITNNQPFTFEAWEGIGTVFFHIQAYIQKLKRNPRKSS